jgi:hypothetical protein
MTADQRARELVTSLLKKEELNKCIENCHELAKIILIENNMSLAEVIKLLWTIYYDFYFEITPDYADELNQMCVAMCLTNVHASLSTICTQLFNLPTSPLVFTVRQKNPVSTTILYKGIPAWLTAYETRFHTLLRAIKKGDHLNVYYYMKKLFAASSDGAAAEIVQVMSRYYKEPVRTLFHTGTEVKCIFALYASLQRKKDAVVLPPQVKEVQVHHSTTDIFKDLIARQNLVQRLEADKTLLEMHQVIYNLHKEPTASGAAAEQTAAEQTAEQAADILVKTRAQLERIGDYTRSQLSAEELALYSGPPSPEEYAEAPYDKDIANAVAATTLTITDIVQLLTADLVGISISEAKCIKAN